VGKVQRWKAAGKAAGMVGYNKAGKATVVIMPVVLNR
jgi:ABC-type polysaccharide/polyol phosphate transport system ATPase subunit